jgi:hypothetical protein
MYATPRATTTSIVAACRPALPRKAARPAVHVMTGSREVARLLAGRAAVSNSRCCAGVRICAWSVAVANASAISATRSTTGLGYRHTRTARRIFGVPIGRPRTAHSLVGACVRPEGPADRSCAQCHNLAAPTCNEPVGLGVAAFSSHVAPPRERPKALLRAGRETGRAPDIDQANGQLRR